VLEGVAWKLQKSCEGGGWKKLMETGSRFAVAHILVKGSRKSILPVFNEIKLQWRQRELKVGRRGMKGGSVEGDRSGEGQSPSSENILFCDREMAYVGEF